MSVTVLWLLKSFLHVKYLVLCDHPDPYLIEVIFCLLEDI